MANKTDNHGKKSTWDSLACQRNSKYVFNNKAKKIKNPDQV